MPGVHPEDRTVERERKWLVSRLPPLPTDGEQLRQGYLALDGDVAVRIRDVDARRHTLTIKAGTGAVRTEVEHELGEHEFEALWPSTAGRRVEKTRYQVPLDGHVAEVDVFGGDLAGLVVVEVEFLDDEAMAAFVAPPWFGPDVTADRRYANAALALAGHPPDPTVEGAPAAPAADDV